MSAVSPARPAPGVARARIPDRGRDRTPFPLVSVIVPTRNEAKNLEIVLPAIAAVRPAVHEIIVVDGNSTDGSIDVARRVLPSVKAITQTRKGKGNAMACGFAAATGDVIVMFDADGSADPAEIPAFVVRAGRGRRLRQGQPVRPRRRQRRHHPAAHAPATRASTASRTRCSARRTPTSATATTPSGPTSCRCSTCPPSSARRPRRECCGATVSRSRRCSTAGSPRPGLRITEVPSVERQRMFGETNLRTFADGARVLRTLLAEHRRADRRSPPHPLTRAAATPEEST